MGGQPRRVFVLAGSASARRGLEGVLRDESEFTIVGSGTLGDAIPPAADLVLAEVESGLLEVPPVGAAWVVLVDDPNAGWLTDGLRGTLRGVLARQADGEEIVAALRAAALNLVTLIPSYLSRLGAPPPPPALDVNLSSREREILTLLAEGLGNREIGFDLHISEHTVKFHLGSLFSKLGVNGRAEAVASGLRRGFVLL